MHTVEYYSVMKRGEFVIFATTVWMNLRSMLSGKRQTERPHVFRRGKSRETKSNSYLELGDTDYMWLHVDMKGLFGVMYML